MFKRRQEAEVTKELFVDCSSPDFPASIALQFENFKQVHTWIQVRGDYSYAKIKRTKHTVVAYKGVIYLFGGDNGFSMQNRFLKFDIKRKIWESAYCIGKPPTARCHHSAVVHENSMFIFGGFQGSIHSRFNLNYLNDLYEYKFPSWEWKEWRFIGRTPKARSGHGAVVHGGKMWIFAGYDGNVRLNDMWAISLLNDSTGWTEILQLGERPPACCKFPVAVAKGCMFVFSGETGAKNTSSLFQFKFKNLTWTKISTDHIIKPQARFGHTMVAHGRHLYVFGGSSDRVLLNDLHCYDLDTKIWSVIVPSRESEIPRGRLFHAAATVGNEMYVFGGTINNGESEEIFRINFSPCPKCTLRDDFGKLLEKKEFCDLEFLLGEEGVKVGAHVAVVTARSSYLAEEIKIKQLARNEHLETVSGTKDVPVNEIPPIQIKLPEVKPDTFQIILKYIYTDKIEPAKKSGSSYPETFVLLMMDVYNLAHVFKINGLIQRSSQLLERKINKSNVLPALQYAVKLELFYIKWLCLTFITKDTNFRDIVLSEEFRSIEKELLIEIIRFREAPNTIPIPKIPNEIDGTGLEQDMKNYLRGGGNDFSDVILKLENNLIPAHKAILAARSTYFQGMFRSFMPKDKRVNIQIGDIIPSQQAFDSLLRYIYYGDIQMPPEDSLYLFSAPYFYGFSNDRINTLFKENLVMNVSIDHILPILEAADSMSAIDMKKYALRIVVDNFVRVSKLPRLKNLSRSLLLDILESLAAEMNLQQ